MKKLVFDFDGTLVDSMPAYGAMMLKVLDDNNVAYPDDIIKIITPLGYKGTAEYFIKNLDFPVSVDEAMKSMHEIAIYSYTYEIPAKETVPETLRALKKLGYSLNVLTASPHLTLDVCLKRNEIYDLFDNVWSCEDFNTTKSDVNIYYMVAKALGTTVDDCIFFDDNINADMTAKSAGMKVIGVYDDSSREYVDEMKRVCDGYIRSFSEITEELL